MTASGTGEALDRASAAAPPARLYRLILCMKSIYARVMVVKLCTPQLPLAVCPHRSPGLRYESILFLCPSILQGISIQDSLPKFLTRLPGILERVWNELSGRDGWSASVKG